MQTPITDWSTVLKNATVYKARLGRRREYKTKADALAYEDGYSSWPVYPEQEPGAAFLTGWLDHETQFLDCADDDRRGDDRLRDEAEL